MTLQEKIEKSIELIRKMERSALTYSADGFHVAFSGGKDSQVIYELAKMAGVKFKGYFYKTSVDPKELLSFIRNNYPEVVWLYPEKTMFQLILLKKTLPYRFGRWCCEVLKERNGLNRVTIVGVRRSESKKRADTWKEVNMSCKLGKDKIIIAPILDWTDEDVWMFIKAKNIDYCSLYDSRKRIGCIGCPMQYYKSQREELNQNPNVKKAYVNTCQKIIDTYPDCTFSSHFIDGEDAVKWWTSNKSIAFHKTMRDKQFKLDL